MKTVPEIEAAIAQLSKKDFCRLTDRLIAMREKEWHRQIEADARAGKLDPSFEPTDRDCEAGRCREL